MSQQTFNSPPKETKQQLQVTVQVTVYRPTVRQRSANQALDAETRNARGRAQKRHGGGRGGRGHTHHNLRKRHFRVVTERRDALLPRNELAVVEVHLEVIDQPERGEQGHPLQRVPGVAVELLLRPHVDVAADGPDRAEGEEQSDELQPRLPLREP